MSQAPQIIDQRREAAEAPTRRGSRSDRESQWWYLSAAVIGLHVIDDNFLQPEPGMSAGDHLLSGLVPLGVLGALLGLCVVLPAGGRAAGTLILGVLGVTASSEAVYYTSQGELGGDEFTGWLCLPAGLILIGQGVLTLWRSRKRTGNRVLRYLRRLLLVLVALVVAQFVLYPVGYAYVYTHVMRVGVPEPLPGLTYEDVELTTSDGLHLAGWYVPSQNGAAVMVTAGRIHRQEHVRMLAAHGYGVLVFDRRGEGASEGDPMVIGWGGDRDVKAAIAYLQDRPDVDPDRIGGIGLSVGGEMLLETAAETGDLRAVVSEGAGARSYLEVGDVNRSTIVDRLVIAVQSGAVRVLSNEPVPPRLTNLVDDIAPTPVFFVYGEDGQFAEVDLNPTYYESAGEPKDIWEIPGAEHVGGLRTTPEEYERRIVEFFDDAMAE